MVRVNTMGQAAYKLDDQPNFTIIDGGNSTQATVDAQPSKEMIVLSIILALLQVSDGVLTGMGMSMFGTAAEGNLLLRTLMEAWGYIPALFIAKSFAILVIAGLCYLSTVVSWLPRAMRCVIAVYVLAAVIPWTYILLTHSI